VEARVTGPSNSREVEISQPHGRIEPVPNAEATEAEILSVLGVSSNDLAALPIHNACTSRVKTLVPLKRVEVLDGLQPDYRRMNDIYERIGSTGLYPYACSDLPEQVFDARQFPKSSGYPEDAATGIAASALCFGLLHNGLVGPTGRKNTVRQGRAMDRPSEITVRFRSGSEGAVQGCWLGGSAQLDIGHGT